MSITIIGASSGPGRMLYETLLGDGIPVTGIARNPRNIPTNSTAKFVQLDASNTQALAKLMNRNTLLVHCSRPEILTALIALKLDINRLIALGSTRIYTRFPDKKCARLADMSNAIWMGETPATLLHPTMIYGAPGLNNIERVAQIARISPFIPLPNNGKSLIQPVLASDVVKAIRACMDNRSSIGKTIVVPGKSPVTYRRFVELCIEFAGEKCRVVSIPITLLSLLAPMTRWLPGVPVIAQDEVRRLLENKDFSTEDLYNLGIQPVALDVGLKTLPFERRPKTDT
jgi:nucleoside-diphosphate-sugar epimerase